jgi:hypothetical protein
MKSWRLLVMGVLLVQALPASGQPQLVKGKELLQQGEISAALVELRRAVASAPKNTAAWYWLVKPISSRPNLIQQRMQPNRFSI